MAFRHFARFLVVLQNQSGRRGRFWPWRAWKDHSIMAGVVGSATFPRITPLFFPQTPCSPKLEGIGPRLAQCALGRPKLMVGGRGSLYMCSTSDTYNPHDTSHIFVCRCSTTWLPQL